MTSLYHTLIEKYGYNYYMISQSIYNKTVEPLINDGFWILSDIDSFYKLLGPKDIAVFYYNVSLNPNDNELHCDGFGRIFAESIFIDSGPFLFSDHPSWEIAEHCHDALQCSSIYAKYIKSRDPRLFSYMETRNPAWILNIANASKCHHKWKIDALIRNPYLLKDCKELGGDSELNTAIFNELSIEYWQYIKKADRKLLKKMMDIDTVETLKWQKIPDTEFIIPYLKKNPDLIFLIKNPTFTMYSVAFDVKPLQIFHYPFSVIVRLIASCNALI